MMMKAHKKEGGFAPAKKVRTVNKPEAPLTPRHVKTLISRALAPLQRELHDLRETVDALEDDAAARILRDDPGGERFPADVARRLVAGDHPLRVFRDHRGMTQSDLAAAADTSEQYISQIERNTRDAGKKLLTKLASALAVDEEDLRA